MKLYIKAKSKAEINRRIKEGETIIGTEYNAFNPEGYMTHHALQLSKTGTTVAIFKDYSMGSPVAESWGTWNQEKEKLS